jgi:hypothetical protein
MCDYSLENVASRHAAVADDLVSTTFPNTITRGFAAAEDMNVCVCLMPGTELAFAREVEYEHPVTHARMRAAARTARFREVDRDNPYAHHDALEFPDGTMVPLTRLVAGQRATVLQLPAPALRAKVGTQVRPAEPGAATGPEVATTAGPRP